MDAGTIKLPGDSRCSDNKSTRDLRKAIDIAKRETNEEDTLIVVTENCPLGLSIGQEGKTELINHRT